MKKILPIVLTFAVILVASQCVVAENDKAEAEIRQVQTEQANAWNQHDAAAYANLFTEDGEVINVVGWWWKGRIEIQKKLTAAFAFVFKESTLTITDVQVRFLTPEIAIAHVSWTMTGSKTPPNIPEPKQGIELQVLQKQNSQWKILSFQNTVSLPETPFPLGPPPKQ